MCLSCTPSTVSGEREGKSPQEIQPHLYFFLLTGGYDYRPVCLQLKKKVNFEMKKLQIRNCSQSKWKEDKYNTENMPLSWLGICLNMQVPVTIANQIQQEPYCRLWANLVLERFSFAGNLVFYFNSLLSINT